MRAGSAGPAPRRSAGSQRLDMLAQAIHDRRQSDGVHADQQPNEGRETVREHRLQKRRIRLPGFRLDHNSYPQYPKQEG